jgi:glycerol-3-phosphate dehydrogenase
MKEVFGMKPLQTDRAQLMARIDSVEEFDLAIIGGGATGLGTAVDAAVRGLKVLLVEAHDFAKGTSSRSTKLVHGGVRYLAQGQLPLVWEALHERQNLLRNAPHLAHAMPFVMPAYRRMDQWFYGVGLKLYDLLAGRAGVGPTRFLNRTQTLAIALGAKATNLVGGVQYWDGQFDDARLALALARTAAAHGALLINHMPVTGLLTESGTGKVCGLTCADSEAGLQRHIKARCVVNATGVWVDDIEAMTQTRVSDNTPTHVPHAVRPSQGVHLVVDASFWPGETALLVPRTQDGRVLFAVPWQGKVLLGTTDTPKSSVDWEPQALAFEIDQILDEASRYLVKAPTRSDVTSVWAGLRPLAGPPSANNKAAGATKNISREHTIKVATNGLVSVTGGKWTTYRAMAADVMQSIREAQLLSLTAEDVTVHTEVWGARTPQPADALAAYGTDADVLTEMQGHDQWLSPKLSEAMVRFAARYEYARTVEDVLARRNRLLFLDAKEAAKVAPEVARILKDETGVDPHLDAFLALAKGYQIPL